MKNRIGYIDNAKGLLIFLAVLGHCINGENFLKNAIYSFHMPAFFIASGILLNYSSTVKKAFRLFIKSRIKQLLIPYIIFEFLGYIVQCLIDGFYENLNGFIFRTATFQVHTDVDWFLIGLFFGEILFYFSNKNKYIGVIAGIVSFIISYFVPVRFIKWILSAFVYLIIGYYGIAFFQKRRNWFILCAGIIDLIASYLNVRVDINKGIFGNPLLYLSGAVSGTYLVMTLCQLKTSLSSILNFGGRNSLIVMGTHTLILQIFWHKIFNSQISDWVASACILLTVLILEWLIILLFGKMKYNLVNRNSVSQQKIICCGMYCFES